MGTLDYKERYKRNLPHFQPKNATLFVTFRLLGSVPQEIVEQYRSEKLLLERQIEVTDDEKTREELSKQLERLSFVRFEAVLDRGDHGPRWMKEPDIADMIAASLKHRDNNVWELDAFCIMSNHVHLVFRLRPDARGAQPSLSKAMQSLKGYTASIANKMLGREGQFWEHESYDRAIRDEDEWNRIVRYVLHNPVKAGLVSDWREWRWSYFRLGAIEI